MKNFKVVLFLVVAFIFTCSYSSQATVYTYTWSGGAGTSNWQTAGNWSSSNPTGYPVDNDNVIISSSTTINVPSTISTLGNFTTTNVTLTFNSSITLTGAVSITSTTLSPTGSLTINNSSNAITLDHATFNINLSIISTSTSVTLNYTTCNGTFDMTNGFFFLTHNIFNSTTTITKNAAYYISPNMCNNNLFNGVFALTQTGTGYIFFANDNDVFTNEATFTNSSGANQMRIGSSTSYTAPTTFKAKTTFINNANNELDISSPGTSHVIFQSATASSIDVIFENNGQAYMNIGDAGGIDFFNSQVSVSSTYVPTNAAPYTGAIKMGNSLGTATANRIKFDAYSNLSASTVTVAFGMTGVEFQGPYTTGVTYTPALLDFTGNAFFFNIGLYCKFDRDVKVEVTNLTGLVGTYNGKTTVIQSSKDCVLDGALDNGLNFYNDVTFIHNYPSTGGTWYLFGGNSSSTAAYGSFNNPVSGRSLVTISSQSPSPMIFGYLPGAISFNGVDIVIEHTTTGYMYFGYESNMLVNDNSSLTFKQTVAGSINVGNEGNPPVTLGIVTLDGTQITNGAINFNSLLAKENFSIESIIGSTNAASYKFSEVTFNKTFSLKAPSFFLTGGTLGGLFKDDAIFYKYQTTGTLDQISYGHVTFEKTFTLINNSSHYFIIGSSSSDVYTFEGNVELEKNSTGSIGFARTGVCIFQGNLDFQGDFGSYPWGETGSCLFNGTTDQTFTNNCSASSPFVLTKLEINKNSGKLIIANKIKIFNYSSTVGILTLRKGDIVTSMSLLPDGVTPVSTLTIDNGATIAGGSKNSFVEGPLSKIGNIAFKFYLGKSGKYFPVSIAAPSTTTAMFTAEFFDAYQSSGTSLNSNLKDAVNCQYWKIDKSGTSTAADVTLFWNNDPTQACYPINHSIVSVARFNGTNWESEGSNVLNDYQPADSGYVKSTTGLTSYGYFALGYRNALVLNTFNTNPTKFKIYNNIEPITSIFTSGPSGSPAGDRTMLSSAKNVAGNVVVHPSFSSEVDVQINQLLTGTPTDTKANYVNYTLLNEKVFTTADGSTNVVDHVTIDEDGDNTFLQLLSDVHQISGNTLTFYKQKPAPVLFELTNNLSDAITFTIDRYLTIPYSPFQITSTVPTGYAATLNVYDNSGGTTPIYTNNTDLSWNAKTGTTTFSPEGLYNYEVVLTNGTDTKTYKGQLVLKQQ